MFSPTPTEVHDKAAAETIAHALPALLGPEWSLQVNDEHRSGLSIVSGDKSLEVSYHGAYWHAADAGKLRLSAHANHGLYDHMPHDTRNHSISVSNTKSADKIAAEIKRRLLPDFEAALQAAYTNRDRITAAVDQAEANAARLVAVSPEQVRYSGYHRDAPRDSRDRLDVNLSSQLPGPYAMRVTADSVRFEAHSMPVELAVQVMQVVADYAAKHPEAL